MWSITFKLMRKSMKMLVPAGIAILIGTAFIASTFLFSNAMDDSLRSQMTAQFGQANYVVVDNIDNIAQGSSGSGMVKDLKLDALRRIDGVSDARADVSLPIQISYRGSHASSMGVSTARDARILPVSIVRGSQPRGSDQIAIPQAAASQLHVNVGDTVEVSQSSGDSGGGATSSRTLRVVGVTRDSNKAYPSYNGAAVVSDEALASLSGMNISYDSYPTGMAYLYIDPGRSESAVRTVKKTLPSSFTVDSRQKIGDRLMKSLSAGGTSIVTTFLLSFGVLAMFVAALVIANTFQVLVAQRRRTLALLRTIGAKKGQLYRSVLTEAMVLGLIASVLGVAVGIGLMAIVCSAGLLQGMGLNARLILSWQVFAVPVVFGIVMTVLASFSSARSATNVTPLEALRPLEAVSSRRSGRVRAVISALLVVGGIALTGFALWQVHASLHGGGQLVKNHYSAVLLMAIVGCLMVFLGLVISAVFWLPRLMKGIGALVALCGPSAKVAHANIQKNPRRIAATGAALLIGVTLVSCIATGAASAKQTMGKALDTHYSVDMVIQGEKLSEASAARIKQAKGIASTLYAPYSMARITDSRNRTEDVVVVGVKEAGDIRTVMRTSLAGITLGSGTALLPETSSVSGRKLHFGSGTVRATPLASTGEGRAISLHAVQTDYRRISDSGDMMFVNRSYFDTAAIPVTGHIVLAKVDSSSQSVSQTFTDVTSIVGKDGGVVVSGPVSTRMQWEGMIDSMMSLLIGLLAVAVLIALIGVANTLSLSVIERTKESATLRAIGMTRGQLKRSLAVEALLISLVSGLAGVVLGTLFGWAGSYMVFSVYGQTVFPFEWPMNIAILGISALAALLASVFPARRAVRTSPVVALAES